MNLNTNSWRNLLLSLTASSKIYVARSVLQSWKAHNNLEELPNSAVAQIILSFIFSSISNKFDNKGIISGGEDKLGSYLSISIPGDIYGRSSAYLVLRESEKENFDLSVTTITGATGALAMGIIQEVDLHSAPSSWILNNKFIVLFREELDEEEQCDHYTAYTFDDGSVKCRLRDIQDAVTDILYDIDKVDIKLFRLQTGGFCIPKTQ